MPDATGLVLPCCCRPRSRQRSRSGDAGAGVAEHQIGIGHCQNSLSKCGTFSGLGHCKESLTIVWGILLLVSNFLLFHKKERLAKNLTILVGKIWRTVDQVLRFTRHYPNKESLSEISHLKLQEGTGHGVSITHLYTNCRFWVHQVRSQMESNMLLES